MAIIQQSVLLEWQKKYTDFKVVRKLKSGKEADAWLVSMSNTLYVLKNYKGNHMRTRDQYNEGKWIHEASLRKAIRQKTNIGKNLQKKLWVKREYYIMKKVFAFGAAVPEVFDYTADSILMQYIGDAHHPAPRLIDVHFSDHEKKKILMIIESNLKLFLENGIIHADLSPYNILWWNNKPWIIDFPQSIDIRKNPNWEKLYNRDLENIKNYLGKK